jgi:soluble lytic murein transglycosylase
MDWKSARLTWLEKGVSIKPTSKSATVLQLAKLKEAQSQGQWKVCGDLAHQVFSFEPKSTETWIRLAELDCALKNLQEVDERMRAIKVGRGPRGMGRLPASVVKGKKDKVIRLDAEVATAAQTLREALAHLDQAPLAFQTAPFENLLRERWKQASLVLLDTSRGASTSKTIKLAEALLKREAWFNSSDRALIFRTWAQALLEEKKHLQAQTLFLRSLTEEDNSEARSKIKSLDGILSTERLQGLAARKREIKDERLDIPAEETALADKITQAAQSGDALRVVETSLDLIQRFPGGSRTSWAVDRVFEVLQANWDSSENKQGVSRERILSAMKQADATRLQGWAHSSFRSEQYETAKILAEAAIVKSEPSVALKALYIAARSSYFIGNFSAAEDWFEKVISRYPSTEEAVESQFLLGLGSFRQKKFERAVAHFDRLLSNPRSSNNEIRARYWRWRALMKTDAALALKEGQYLMARFPLTYYGLLARFEIRKSIEDFDDARERFEEGMVRSSVGQFEPLSLTSVEAEGRLRMKLLIEAGWLDEARIEAAQLPTPGDPRGRAEMSQVWAAVYDFPKVISNINRSWEEDATLIEKSFIRAAFPTEFSDLIQAEANLRKLDPNLVRSLMRQESAFAMKAVSVSGALGLMQMIPPTAQEVAQDLKVKNLKLPEDLFNPKNNIRFCTYYLGKLLMQFEGNVPMALAGYNAGPSRVKRFIKARGLDPVSAGLDETWFDEIPLIETQGYVKAILRNLLIYQWLDQGRVEATPLFWVQPLRALGPKPETT